jgi:hypothetical protein
LSSFVIGMTLLGSIAAIFIAIGLPARRIGEEPRCRRCGVELGPTLPGRCPECGADLALRRAIRHGQRRRRRLALVTGLLLAGVLLLGLATRTVGWMGIAPSRWLAAVELPAADGQRGERILSELAGRARSGDLADGPLRSVVELAMARQAAEAAGAPRGPWLPAFPAFVLEAAARGVITPAELERFALDGIGARLDLEPAARALAIRPRLAFDLIRVAVPADLDGPLTLSGLGRPTPLIDVSIAELAIGGEPLAAGTGGSTERPAFASGQGGGAFGPTEIVTDLSPGPQPVRLVGRFRCGAAQRMVALEATATLLERDVALDHEDIARRLAASLALEAVEAEATSAGQILHVTVRFDETHGVGRPEDPVLVVGDRSLPPTTSQSRSRPEGGWTLRWSYPLPDGVAAPTGAIRLRPRSVSLPAPGLNGFVGVAYFEEGRPRPDVVLVQPVLNPGANGSR